MLNMLSPVWTRLRRNFSDRQIKTVLAFAVAEVCQAICVSLQAPFYPKEAERKHATPTEYGLVFGVFELVVFFACPVIGPRLKSMGAKRTFHTGIFVTGSCAILFGLLDFVESRHWFIWLSVLVRAIEAVGNSCFLTSAFSIIALEFPDRVGSMFAVLETFFGLGLIIGPTVGGALYQMLGYIAPFALLGGFLVIASIATYYILPKSLEEGPTRNGEGYATALRIPQVFLSTFSILCASSSIGFLLTALEPHLRVFELSPFFMGLMFVLNGGSYALSAPIWGMLCDRPNVHPLAVNAVGAVLILLGFVLLGPAPFLPMENHMGTCVVSLVLHGIGIGAVLVSSFSASQRGALAYGFVDGMETYGMISGLWSSIFALGAFVGPVAAGVLMDWCGLRWATQFITVLCALHLFLLLAYAVVKSYFRTRRDRDGYEEIAEDDDEYYRNGVASVASDYSSNGSSSGVVHIPSVGNSGTLPGITVSSAPAMASHRRPRSSVVAHNRLSHPRSPAGLFGGVHGFAYINSPDAAALTTAHSHHYIATTNDVPITSSHLEVPHEFHALPHEIPEELSTSVPRRGATRSKKSKKARKDSPPSTSSSQGGEAGSGSGNGTSGTPQ